MSELANALRRIISAADNAERLDALGTASERTLESAEAELRWAEHALVEELWHRIRRRDEGED